jgi:hypothetical protein
MTNTLYYGDNLHVLREHVASESVTGRKHSCLQILTLTELFQGKRLDIPWVDASVLKSAKREEQGKQGTLL